MKRFFLVLMVLALSVPVLAQTWSKDLEKAAKKGDVTAQLAVGNAYFNGDGVDADKEKAAQWYSKAALANSAEAKEKLYSFYSKELEKLAKKGDVTAQLAVGDFYFKGEGVDADKVVAAKWYNMATLANSAEGKEKLYSFYSKELEKLAKQGDVTAQLAVGDFYFKGEGVNADKAVAAKWYYMATLANSAEGKKKLCSFYSKELEKLAKNDTEALYHLGCLFFDGNSVAKDVKKGLKYLDKARKQKHPKALEKMASTYTQEFADKVGWMSVREGNCDGVYYLGLSILNGRGCDANVNAAANYFEFAMKRGHKKSAEMFYKIYSDALLKKSNNSNIYGTDFGYVNADGYQCLIDLNAKKILMTAPSDSTIVADNFEYKFGNGAFFKGKIKVVKIGNSKEPVDIALLSGYVVIENDTFTIADPIYESKISSRKLYYAPKVIDEVVKEDTIALRVSTINLSSPKIAFDVKNWTKTTTIPQLVGRDLKPEEDVFEKKRTVIYHSGKSWISVDPYSPAISGGFHLETDEGIWIKSGNGYEIGRCDFFNTATGELEEQKYYRFDYYPETIIDGLRSFNKEKAQKIFASTEGHLMNFKNDDVDRDSPIQKEKFYFGMNSEQYAVYKDKIAEKEALESAKKYIKEVEKEYGSTQANLLRNKSNLLNPKKNVNYLIKGLHIDIVRTLMDNLRFTHALEHSVTYDDGTSVYYIILYWGGTKNYVGKIWFKNNYITSWVKY